MTNDPSSSVLLTEPEARPARRRVNGWELALWILGVLLLASGIVFVFTDIRAFLQDTIGTPSESGLSLGFVETSSSFTPAALIGGILCIALAMFARAIDTNAIRRDAAHECTAGAKTPAREAPAEFVAPTSAFTSAPAPAPVPASRPLAPAAEPITDFSPFMRPAADGRKPRAKKPNA